MTFDLSRTVVAFAILFVLCTANAQAGAVSCPSHLSLNGVPFPNITNPAPTASISGGKLNCSFAVYYSDTTAVHVVSPGVCAPASVSLNFGVSGGTGAWNVAPRPVVLTSHYLKAPTTGGPGGTVRRGLTYCYVGTPLEMYALTPAFTLIASQPIPAGGYCQVTGPNSFSCTQPICPATIASRQIPTGQFPSPPSWSPLPTSGSAWFYQAKSGIDQLAGPTTNGALFEPQNVSLQNIEDAMNQQSRPAFNGSTWTALNTQGAPIAVPAGYVACQYTGSPFPFTFSSPNNTPNYTLAAVVAIVCKGASCSL